MKTSALAISLVLFLVVFDFFIWTEIVFNQPNKNTAVYFLDVGQGDGELVVLPDNIKVLIDGGPNNKVLNNLSSIFSFFDRYIDLIVLSHPQLDHFGGLIDVLKRYQVGAFIYNGRQGETPAFNNLEKALNKNNIPVIILAEGDKIKYQDNRFDILSPSDNFLASAELNDTALVMRLLSQGAKILFTGDIGFSVEKYLVSKYELASDVLKVAHHGSKFSSGGEFLKAVSPKISVIEVGKNFYGHPAEQTLSRLISIGSQIFRTDKNGIVKLEINNGQLNIFKEK